MKKGVEIAVIIIAAVLALAIVGLAIIFLSGNQITVARCIVTENGEASSPNVWERPLFGTGWAC